MFTIMCAEISFYLRLNTKVAFKNVIIDRHCSFKYELNHANTTMTYLWIYLQCKRAST